jgi:hypothetical protein
MLEGRRRRDEGRRPARRRRRMPIRRQRWAKAPKAFSLLLASFELVLVYDLICACFGSELCA